MHLIQVAQPLLGIRSGSPVHLLEIFSRVVDVHGNPFVHHLHCKPFKSCQSPHQVSLNKLGQNTISTMQVKIIKLKIALLFAEQLNDRVVTGARITNLTPTIHPHLI